MTEIQALYVRVCRDSGFRMEAARAAHMVAVILKTDALKVWLELGTDNMDRIAAGTHPCLTQDAA